MRARPWASEVALKSSRPSRWTLSFTSGIGFPSLSRTVTRRIDGGCAELAKGKPITKSRRVNKDGVHNFRGAFHSISLLGREFG